MIAPATGLPFDDFRALLTKMPAADEAALAKVRERDRTLTKPPGSLGRLEEIVEWLAAWQGKAPPTVQRPLVAVFAGNHGVVKRGISAYPQAVTQQMVINFAAGGAAINQICAANDLSLKVYDLALDLPTRDIVTDAALEEAECAATMAFGMEAINGVDLLCIGEMGIGNTTVAAAIYAAVFGGSPEGWVGRGTGLDDTGVRRKADVVAAALAHHAGHLRDGFEVLRRLGGREVAAMTGAILAARMNRVPVIVDGFVATAAAAVLYAMEPAALDHCLFAHLSAEQAHRVALDRMGKKPLLDLGMRLGEGTGAAIAAGIVRTAVRLHTDMATFAQAGVSNRS